MTTQVGVGESRELDSFAAGAQAGREALKAAQSEACDFVLVFATVAYDQAKLLAGVRSVTGQTPLSGCSAEGIITRNGPQEDAYRVAVMVIRSDEMKFTHAIAKGLKDNSLAAGESIGRALAQTWPANPVALLCFPDGLTVNTDALFRGLSSSLTRPVPFVGGTAGDTELKFVRTYQYHDGEVLTDAVSCILVSGDVRMEVGVSHGSEPLGIEKTITRAEGNHVFEIDGKPAFELYREFFGPDLTELAGDAVVGACLGIATPKEIENSYEQIILRVPVRLDKSDHSLFLPAELPTGTKVFICRRDPEKILQGTKRVAKMISDRIHPQKPKMVLNFDCAGRGKFLIGADMARQEVAAAQDPLGHGIPWLGWYTYGEIAPVGKSNYFHNWTSVLCAFY